MWKYPEYKVGDKVGDNLTTNQQQIIKMIQENPTISARLISKNMGISQRKVEVNISILKKKDHIQRIGSPKGGHWEVLMSTTHD